MTVLEPTEGALRMAREILDQFARYELLGKCAGASVDRQKLYYCALCLTKFAQDESELWRDRYEAELQAHEATIEAMDFDTRGG